MLKKLIYSLSIVYLTAMVTLYVDSIEEGEVQADYGIVYGNKVNPDGTPSKRLKARLDASIALLERGQVRALVVSGGTGKEGFSEADVMQHYLLKSGIPNGAIIVDADGYTSSQTSKNAFGLVEKGSRVIAISQCYHLSRAKLSLRNAGFITVYGYCPDYYELRDIYSIVREVPAWLKYWFQGL
ncbi:YdcF family protein [Spartinivicinus poritis]|uniref:YdcF family protein n=1 Tax=Spartinivicinus poritis TaxID=2994640 RepID=A0ABT5U3N1_9GAMM|nr:YdcF family protein [Spartinivicinus sp. A2-2]MDE1460970.1 YdcF family protein [Spartinivicinus sp. A2-2]